MMERRMGMGDNHWIIGMMTRMWLSRMNCDGYDVCKMFAPKTGAMQCRATNKRRDPERGLQSWELVSTSETRNPKPETDC